MTVFSNDNFRAGSVRVPKTERDISQGKRFTFAHRFDAVADGSTVQVFANNPNDAAKVIVGTRTITAEASCRLETFVNVTQDTAGTSQTERNDLLTPSGEPASDVTWETGGTYSNKGNSTPGLVPGGAGGTRSGGTGQGATAAVRPGTNLLWEITSQSTDNDILFVTTYTQA